MRFWAQLANAKGRYSHGSSDTLLDQDLAIIRQGGAATELLDRLRQQVGRLEVEAEELEGRNQRSALFKTMFMAFKDQGAKDWWSNLAISLDHSGIQHRLQFHHIFPKAILKDKVGPREADDIANLAFIAGRTNRGISASPPHEYFSNILQKSGKSAFETQCIPTDPGLLSIDKYKEFLVARRRLIATRINTFLGMENL